MPALSTEEKLHATKSICNISICRGEKQKQNHFPYSAVLTIVIKSRIVEWRANHKKC